jgi:hypothetical protein
MGRVNARPGRIKLQSAKTFSGLFSAFFAITFASFAPRAFTAKGAEKGREGRGEDLTEKTNGEIET